MISNIRKSSQLKSMVSIHYTILLRHATIMSTCCFETNYASQMKRTKLPFIPGADPRGPRGIARFANATPLCYIGNFRRKLPLPLDQILDPHLYSLFRGRIFRLNFTNSLSIPNQNTMYKRGNYKQPSTQATRHQPWI